MPAAGAHRLRPAAERAQALREIRCPPRERLLHRWGGMQPDRIARPHIARVDVQVPAYTPLRDERVLVIYSKLGDAKPAAEALAHELTQAGLVVELAVAHARTTPPPHDYDAVVIASSMWIGHHAPSIVGYAAQYREALAEMPAFLCVVSRGRGASLARMRRGLDWPLLRVHCLVRPRWHPRWLGGPHACRARPVHQLALVIAHEIPVRDPR